MYVGSLITFEFKQVVMHTQSHRSTQTTQHINNNVKIKYLVWIWLAATPIPSMSRCFYFSHSVVTFKCQLFCWPRPRLRGWGRLTGGWSRHPGSPLVTTNCVTGHWSELRVTSQAAQLCGSGLRLRPRLSLLRPRGPSAH